MTSSTTPSVPGFRLLRPVGNGTAATVYAAHPLHPCHCQPSKPSNIAIKLIPRAKVTDAVRREVTLHLPISHPNIIRLHKVLPAHQQPSLSSPLSLALVMELASAGDMFSEVSAAGSLSPRLVRHRLNHITAGLLHLHQNRIVHLDLKLENVVISNSSTAKLVDFGCARHMDHPLSASQRPALSGTLHYLPPELVKSPSIDPAPSADAWSLGVLMYTALSGAYPFNAALADASDEENDHATRQRILNSPPHSIPSSLYIPPDLRRIMFSLLEKNPALRMTIPQVVSELARSAEAAPFRIPRAFVKSGVLKSKTSGNVCFSGRPRSPSGASEANFAPCNCTCTCSQSREEALQVLDAVEHNKLPVSGLGRFLFDCEKSSAKSHRQVVSTLPSSVFSHKDARTV